MYSLAGVDGSNQQAQDGQRPMLQRAEDLIQQLKGTASLSRNQRKKKRKLLVKLLEVGAKARHQNGRPSLSAVFLQLSWA